MAQYGRHVCRFASWAAADGLPNAVAQLEPEHVARFLASAEALRRPDGRAKRTGSLNALRSSLRGFFTFLEAAGFVERSPARVLRMARVGATPPKGLTAIDVAAVHAVLEADTTVAGRRDHALFSFLLGTGARLGSALALDVGDVDLGAGTATLRELKGGGTMTVYLRAQLVDLLGAATAGRRSGPVFAGRDGGHLSPRRVQRRFEGWLAKAGIRRRYSPHSLRHTFAMQLEDQRRPRGSGRAGAPRHQLDARERQGLGGAGAGGGRRVKRVCDSAESPWRPQRPSATLRAPKQRFAASPSSPSTLCDAYTPI